MTSRFETFTVLINRINRNIRKIKKQEMAEYNLKSADISCLYYIYCVENITAAELCERCEEDKATVSRSLDYLEANGFLTCASSGTKKYKTPIVLTEKGREVAEKIILKINQVLDKVSAELSEEDRSSFYRSLSIISKSLDSVSKKSVVLA